MKERFAEVYRTEEWSNGREFPLSGRGSSLEHTAGVRRNLTQIVKTLFDKRRVLKILDAPCGDMAWMPTWLGELMDAGWRLDYGGVDVVDFVIEHNVRSVSLRHERLKRLEFRCCDVAKDALPAVDLIICKELVNHLCFADIFDVLRNFTRSGSRYVVITSNAGWDNVELQMTTPEASRHIYLLRAPFHLPKPVYEDGFLSVWENPIVV